MARLDGKVVLVTGASRGQGAAGAQLFVSEGARVVLGDVLDEPGAALAESLGDAALYRHHDVSDEASWEAFVEAARQHFGRVDGLVNNAGVLLFSPLLETSLAQYRRVIDVNQVGCFLGMRAVAPAMREGGGGSIVNVSSIAGMRAVPGAIAYVSSKFAIRGLTRTAAAELGPLGIRVNSLHPGGVDTAMARLPAETAAHGGDPHAAYADIPLRRIGQPAEMAQLVLFLLSDESTYCTGAEFVADGGLLA